MRIQPISEKRCEEGGEGRGERGGVGGRERVLEERVTCTCTVHCILYIWFVERGMGGGERGGGGVGARERGARRKSYTCTLYILVCRERDGGRGGEG